MQRADLPPDLQRSVPAELDPPGRLALFRACHTLARTVLLDAPSAKRLTKLGMDAWPPALASLLDDPSLLTLADLELRVEGSAASPPPPPPPAPPPSIARHVARLHVCSLTLTPSSLAAWRLHDAALWPHLQHLAFLKCHLPPATASALPLPPIPRLQSFTWEQTARGGVDSPATLAAVLQLVGQASWWARRLRVISSIEARERNRQVALQALARLPHLTHADVGALGPAQVEALLRHPTLEHVTVGSVNGYGFSADLSQKPCRWRTLTATGWACIASLALLPLGGLERLSISGSLDRPLLEDHAAAPCSAGGPGPAAAAPRPGQAGSEQEHLAGPAVACVPR